MNISFLEQPAFSSVRDDLFGTEKTSSFRMFQNTLMNNPRAGDVIPGTSGARKVRWAQAGRTGGKSGGLRVIYYYHEERAQIVLLRAYAKNEQANVSPNQTRRIAEEVSVEKKQE